MSGIFGDRFGSTRKPLWQSLGTVFTDRPTATEAVNRAGITYQVAKEPLFWGNDPTPIAGKFALVRESTPERSFPEVVGYCGSKYEVLQHSEVAALVDSLTDEWPVETVGALGVGETFFLTLDAGESAVAGDPIKNFFIVTNSTTGGRAVRVAYVPVRVATQTTLVTGLAAASMSSAVQHMNGAASSVGFIVTLLQRMRKAQQTTLGVFEKMAATKITDLRVKQVVEAAFPSPTTPAKVRLLQQVKELGDFDGDVTPLEKVAAVDVYRNERLEAFRQGAMELYAKFNEQNPTLAYTSWAIWNAVVEVSDYRNGATDESIAESGMWGPRSKEKIGAFRVASSLIK